MSLALSRKSGLPVVCLLLLLMYLCPVKEQHYIVVTGASRGIGYAAVRAFAEHPGTVVIGIARGQHGLNALADSSV